jgi:hypothetical protein
MRKPTYPSRKRHSKQQTEAAKLLPFAKANPPAEDSVVSASTAYPYVVVRIMPAVYLHASVHFSSKEPSSAALRKFTVRCANPWIDCQLRPECETILLNLVKSFSRKRRFRCCVVFSPERATYIEPDGTAEYSSFIPHSDSMFEIEEVSSTEGWSKDTCTKR